MADSKHPFTISLKALPPEGEVLEGRAGPAGVLDLPADGHPSLPEPVEYRLHVSRVRGGVLAEGRLSWLLRCECDRCLEQLDLHLELDRVCHFYEDSAADTLDLTDDIREDILLAFPQHVLCRRDCHGLCPQCGADLNRGRCSCSRDAPEPGPWGALDDLSLDGP